MESLRLRAADAELIKNRLTSLSRGTMWSGKNPVAMGFVCDRGMVKGNRQNKNREEKRDGCNFLALKKKDTGKKTRQGKPSGKTVLYVP